MPSMSKSSGLGIAAAVFGVVGIGFALLASANYQSAMNYHGPADWGGQQDATSLAAIPTALAWVGIIAAVVCVVLALALRSPSKESTPAE